MIILVLIGLLGGLITAVSPCILPVLPVVFLAGGPASDASRPAPSANRAVRGAGAARSDVLEADPPVVKQPRNRRPYAVVTGLVISLSFFTLLGVTIVTALGLPEDILRYVGLALLVLIGLGLIFPPVERLLEKPFARIPQRQVNREGGAFVLGLGLGLLYVPCAGPVLAAITVAGAQGHLSLDIVALTVSFAVGTALPLLAFALAGRRVSERIGAFRKRARKLRIAAGGLMIVLALGLASTSRTPSSARCRTTPPRHRRRSRTARSPVSSSPVSTTIPTRSCHAARTASVNCAPADRRRPSRASRNGSTPPTGPRST